MSLACASWETRFWHAWWPHMRGTPAEARGCLVENHAELGGVDTLVIVDSQGNAVWDKTGCSSIHAPSSWQSSQKGVPRHDLYAQWSDACSVCFLNAHMRARMFVFSSPAAGMYPYMGIPGWVDPVRSDFELRCKNSVFYIGKPYNWSSACMSKQRLILHKSSKKRFIWGWSWFEAFSFTNP